MESRVKIGVYISESSITAGIVDLTKGKVIEETLRRQIINPNTGSESIINGWAQTIGSVLNTITNQENKQIDIAIPGPFNYATGVSLMKNQNKYDSLYQLNIKELLSKEIGIAHTLVSLKNDARCFLFGEVYRGYLGGFNNVIGVTIDIGLGCAHYMNNRSKDADLWKMRFLDGITEDYISTKWLIKRWKEISGKSAGSIQEIVEFSDSNKELIFLFENFSENLSQFLYLFIKKNRSTAIVLSGQILAFEHLFFAKTQKHLYDKMGISIPFIKSVNRESSTIIGATLIS